MSRIEASAVDDAAVAHRDDPPAGKPVDDLVDALRDARLEDVRRIGAELLPAALHHREPARIARRLQLLHRDVVGRRRVVLDEAVDDLDVEAERGGERLRRLDARRIGLLNTASIGSHASHAASRSACSKPRGVRPGSAGPVTEPAGVRTGSAWRTRTRSISRPTRSRARPRGRAGPARCRRP